ncbi:MAG: response regulator [Pseudomonadota bacterium]
MTLPFENLKVLLADDYESIRKRLSHDLQRLGFKVVEASNGFEALTKLRSEKFDILFTDLVMPEMDGFELCEEVRKMPDIQAIPIVVVSTHCDNEYILKALRLGADDYVTKPIDAVLLEKVVRRAMIPTLQLKAPGAA